MNMVSEETKNKIIKVVNLLINVLDEDESKILLVELEQTLRKIKIMKIYNEDLLNEVIDNGTMD